LIAGRSLRQSQEYGECSVDSDNRVLMQSTDSCADFVAGHRLYLIYHHLGFFPKTISGAWLNGNSKQRCRSQFTGDGQDGYGPKRFEELGLNDQRWSGLPIGARKHDRNHVATLHFQPSVSATLESHLSVLPSERCFLATRRLASGSKSQPFEQAPDTVPSAFACP
jgi:hypothetical protein